MVRYHNENEIFYGKTYAWDLLYKDYKQIEVQTFINNLDPKIKELGLKPAASKKEADYWVQIKYKSPNISLNYADNYLIDNRLIAPTKKFSRFFKMYETNFKTDFGIALVDQKTKTNHFEGSISAQSSDISLLALNNCLIHVMFLYFPGINGDLEDLSIPVSECQDL